MMMALVVLMRHRYSNMEIHPLRGSIWSVCSGATRPGTPMVESSRDHEVEVLARTSPIKALSYTSTTCLRSSIEMTVRFCPWPLHGRVG